MPTFFKDKTGQRFTRLLVIGIHGRTKHGAVVYTCRCDCGVEKQVVGGALATGYVRSCGCIRSDAFTKHGHAKRGSGRSPTYRIWEGIIGRCTNPRAAGYANYGGRGIAVCERWRKFENFYADMGPLPTRKHSIERKDNDRGYEPGNCVWLLQSLQGRNKRKTVRITVNGITLPLVEAAEAMGVPYSTAYNRYKKGCNPLERMS